MNASMPSPIGHALAGVAVAIAGARRPDAGLASLLVRPLTIACVSAAVLPDADLLASGFHRGPTHSVGATLVVLIVAAGVTAWVTRRSGPSGIGHAAPQPGGGHAASGHQGGHHVLMAGALVAAAHASHILLDWLGSDWFSPPGIQALWPFSDGWFISGWDVFARVERRNPFLPATMVSNLKAVAQEIALVGPVVAWLWWRRRSGKPPRPWRRRGNQA